MTEEEYDFGLWDIPDFHISMIKEIYDDVSREYLETGFKKFRYRLSATDIDYLGAVAKFLSKEYKDNVESSEVFATYGASSGFSILLRTFFEKGDPAIFEDLTFGCFSSLATDYGLNIESVAHDENNDLPISIVEELMRKNSREKPVNEKKPWNGMVYLMSVLHNPKGTSLSEECCKSMVELARKYNYLIVCDDVYNVYNFSSTPAHRILYYDKLTRAENSPGNVVSIGTFSKIVFPSIRMGWIEASEWVIKQLMTLPDLYAGGGYNIHNQGLTAKILTNPRFDDFFAKLKGVYKEEQDKTCRYLKENLPKEVSFRWPDGSFFVWLKLPENLTATVLVEELRKNKVVVNPGTDYSFDGKGFANYIRVAYTNLPGDKMMIGLKIICDVIKKLIA